MSELRLVNDILFKMVFGSEKREPLLRALLNALLELSGSDRIADVTLLNPMLEQARVSERGLVLDVHARDERNRLYNIEVQIAAKPYYVNRSLYYLTRLFSSQLEKGQSFGKIAKTIGISLLDYTLFPDVPDSLHTTYRLCEIKSHIPLSDILEVHYIELSKFDKNQPIRTRFERWLHMLKFAELYQDAGKTPPGLLEEKEMIEVMEAYRQLSASRQVQELVLEQEMAEHTWATELAAAEQKGKAEGTAEGMAEGKAEGILWAASCLLDSGMDKSEVRRRLGLSAEELP